MTGGPPVRGDLLPLWHSSGPLSEDERADWRAAANSVALGIELVAHLEPILAIEELRVGFCCDSEELADLFVERIHAENVGAERREAHPGGINQQVACDVVLPCRPGASREEIDHVVLAAVKAGHGLLCPTSAGGVSRRYV